ncbi:MULTISPECIES: hypothetical protein [Brevibacillus]|uniref:hypothetical protein n=1 Tax=Brevibacillus TaxID=55080 RepID=UPI0007D8B188|nr:MULTISPECIES: hypothetical protein [Bacillales]NRR01818.1 hypothetical protein [Brevibacillus sp. RS1.1]TQR39298.1 hypothetical protein C7Y45_04380 [Lysinibacillus sp. SDF0063]WGV62008.1 hypothetical protein QIH01_12935 [Brevibacillus brevis]
MNKKLFKSGNIIVVLPLLFALLIPASFLLGPSLATKNEFDWKLQAGSANGIVSKTPIDVASGLSYNGRPLRNALVKVTYFDNNQNVSIVMQPYEDGYEGTVFFQESGKYTLRFSVEKGNIIGSEEWEIDVEE